MYTFKASLNPLTSFNFLDEREERQIFVFLIPLQQGVAVKIHLWATKYKWENLVGASGFLTFEAASPIFL